MDSFESIVRHSYDFREDVFRNNNQWRILEKLYNDNFLNTADKNYSILPKKIHQIWLGSAFPREYQRYAQTWSRVHPDWEYRLWTDRDIDSIEIPHRDVFNTIKNQGQRSDFLRYNILNQYGGLYLDTDFECVRSFNSLTYLNFFTGVGYPHIPELYIGLIASTPHHPIIEHIVNSMITVKEGHWRDMFETTGSYFYTRCFFDVVGDFMDGVVAFPTDYFYPFPNMAGHERRNGNDYVKPNSYAIHHWAVSWSKSR